MKKIIVLLAITFCLSSCATVFGGHITSEQTIKPKKGDAPRHIRGAAFFFDIIPGCGLGLIIDFADCAIYRPGVGASEYDKH